MWQPWAWQDPVLTLQQMPQVSEHRVLVPWGGGRSGSHIESLSEGLAAGYSPDPGVPHRAVICSQLSSACSFFILLSWLPTFFKETFPHSKVGVMLPGPLQGKRAKLGL